MLKRVLKGILIFGAVTVTLFVFYYIWIYYQTEIRIHRHYNVLPETLQFAPDSAMRAYGARLVKAKGCTDCHASDLGGKIIVDDVMLGALVATNLTKGVGGLPQDYSVKDWVLALKHGLRRDGKPLLFMPSQEFSLLSERDMSAIVAYCYSLPKVDRVFEASTIGPVARILTHLNKLDLLPAEKIDHSRPLVKEIVAESTSAYGKYLSIACQGCHRVTMKGGDPIAPGLPKVADITSSGNVGHWTEDQFISTLRTGKTPEGKMLNVEDMPWTMTREYTDLELQALYRYLITL